MIRKKIFLVIILLIVLGGSLTGLMMFKNYSDRTTVDYITNKIALIKTEINNNQIDLATGELNTLISKAKTINNPSINQQLKDLKAQLQTKSDEVNEENLLNKINILIKQGSFSEAAFEINRLSKRDLSVEVRNQLNSEKALLDSSAAKEKLSVTEKNNMNTIENLMNNGQYQKAKNVIENIDTTGYSKANLDKIAQYNKQIQAQENKFNLSSYSLSDSAIVNLYKEANPAATGTITSNGSLPTYFIGNTPIYSVNVSGTTNGTFYVSPDGKQITAADMNSALAEKNLYTVDGNNRVPATSIPSDIK